MNNMFYNEERGIINWDDVVDIIIESQNEQSYLKNEILKAILFGSADMPIDQYMELVYAYGATLRQKDLYGRKLFTRMVLLIDEHKIAKTSF